MNKILSGIKISNYLICPVKNQGILLPDTLAYLDVIGTALSLKSWGGVKCKIRKSLQEASENDQEIPQSRTTEQSTAP